MTFTPNHDGINKVFEEIARKLEAVDEDIRSTHAGRPADEVAEVADEKFTAVGVALTPADIAAYSESVSKREPFQFKLQ